MELSVTRQKAPSTTRCIKTKPDMTTSTHSATGQKEPSFRRYIKTGLKLVTSCLYWQKAPSARRYIKTCRPARRVAAHGSQKAPSTRKCIKTHTRQVPELGLVVRRHPAPEGALRPEQVPVEIPFVRSESTQPQKAHEGIYRHVPGDRMPIFSLARQNLDILSSRASSRSRP